MGLIFDLDSPPSIRTDISMPAPRGDRAKLHRSGMSGYAYQRTSRRNSLSLGERVRVSGNVGRSISRSDAGHAPRSDAADAPQSLPRQSHATAGAFRISSDTPIVPHAIAIAVWEEASRWLDADLPRFWITELITRANAIYAHNLRFRSLIRRPGTAGRDWLWSFTRHWLAGLLRRHDPYLYAKLLAATPSVISPL